ncbi:hypothetical protein [Streptomyces bacillaris]|uniref:hypothetical protein n=1 Tax=Streptomyces bacillaris TaxID=68179 RepID=UPI003465A0EB
MSLTRSNEHRQRAATETDLLEIFAAGWELNLLGCPAGFPDLSDPGNGASPSPTTASRRDAGRDCGR